MFDGGFSSRIRISVAVGGIALGLLLVFLKVVLGIEAEPTRDVAAEAGVHAFTGGISQLGILLWGSMVGVALVAGLQMRRLARREEALFFLTATAGLVVISLDDALLFHEDVIPNHLGLEKQVTFPLFGVVATLWAYRFRVPILGSDRILLGLIVAAATLAVIVDLFGLWNRTGEDWIKLVAMIALAGWILDLALRALSAPRPTRAPGGGTPLPEK